MEEARVCYWVPDYYKHFACKGGDCRRSCCEGWPISMSMKDYFRLLGENCSPQLRRKLDVALHLADSPSPERYAQILPDWRGDCPLHRDDGLCMLHAECGENALCDVCRLYPRSPRHFAQPECACSNSCEHTLELLFARTSPLGFERLELPIPMPEAVTGVPEPVLRHYIDLRRLCIDAMQDRSQPLGRRILRIGTMLKHLRHAFTALNESAIEAALQSIPDENSHAVPDDTFALSFLARFNAEVGMSSRSVRDYAAFAAEALHIADGKPQPDSRRRWLDARQKFRQAFPDWEIRFEQILVNHIFYESYPFSDRHENLWDEYLSLCAVCAYFSFLAIPWTCAHPTEEALVDVVAAAFRLIDHSAFDYNAAVILERLGVTEAQLCGLVQGALPETDRL